jgi:mannose-6-phosphate isomerase
MEDRRKSRMIEQPVLYPMKMFPAYKNYIWGGSTLAKRFHKESPYIRTAESWELSCHSAGEGVISNGIYCGLTLSEYLQEAGAAVLGIHCTQFSMFPILIKFIDTNDNVSVQVHPNDAYALEHEHEYGKTEMWYIVDCEPEASIIYGPRKEISKEEFLRHIRKNTLSDILNVVPVHKGDSFLINSGTLHAIGKGCLIVEIQQNSNITYRVYDYGRIGTDGKPRELHIEKALEVITLHPVTSPPPVKLSDSEDYSRKQLAVCPYFTVDLLQVHGMVPLEVTTDSFQAMTCTDGLLVLNNDFSTWQINMGDTFFLPANTGHYTLKGHGDLLLTAV